MANPRQTAGFAISDILELDRNSNPTLETTPSDAPLYTHPTHVELSGYVPRHWTSPPEGMIRFYVHDTFIMVFSDFCKKTGAKSFYF